MVHGSPGGPAPGKARTTYRNGAETSLGGSNDFENRIATRFPGWLKAAGLAEQIALTRALTALTDVKN
jgi:hypothetical protein